MATSVLRRLGRKGNNDVTFAHIQQQPCGQNESQHVGSRRASLHSHWCKVLPEAHYPPPLVLDRRVLGSRLVASQTTKGESGRPFQPHT